MNFLNQHKAVKRSLLASLVVVFLFGLALLVHPFRRDVRVAAQTAVAHMYSTPHQSFPVVPTTALSPEQLRIVSLLAQEYGKKPVSYDATVLHYTQGSKEPWCADFVSWVYYKAGAPFSNPNSGSWRIPGVYTLQAYFESKHTYVKAGAYVPETGDVAIYRTGEGHTNIVLSVHNGIMTTVGGNETGHIRIETQKYTLGADGLDGFGMLQAK